MDSIGTGHQAKASAPILSVTMVNVVQAKRWSILVRSLGLRSQPKFVLYCPSTPMKDSSTKELHRILCVDDPQTPKVVWVANRFPVNFAFAS